MSIFKKGGISVDVFCNSRRFFVYWGIRKLR